LGPACYLWNYLRCSRQAGYLIALSEGIDSCAPSGIVHSMCRMVHEAILKGEDPLVISGLYCIEEDNSTWFPSSLQEITGCIFYTVFIGIEKIKVLILGSVYKILVQ
jgi:NAD+ synthase (glutamine-hydrolysing)